MNVKLVFALALVFVAGPIGCWNGGSDDERDEFVLDAGSSDAFDDRDGASDRTDIAPTACQSGETRVSYQGMTFCATNCSGPSDCQNDEMCRQSVCIPDDGEPRIVSGSITPSEVSASETGMAGSYVSVTIETANFDEGVAAVELELSEYAITEPFNKERTVSVDGDTVTVEKISTSWFSMTSPGVYKISGTVTGSGGAEVSASNLAVVTIKQ